MFKTFIVPGVSLIALCGGASAGQPARPMFRHGPLAGPTPIVATARPPAGLPTWTWPPGCRPRPTG
jgi:hypothetical protein